MPQIGTLGYEPYWERHLGDLMASISNVEGALLLTNNGDLISAVFLPPLDTDRVRTLISQLAEFLVVASSLAEQAERGALEHIDIGGYVILMVTDARNILACIRRNSDKLGLARIEMRRFAKLEPPKARGSEGVRIPKPPNTLTAGARPTKDN